MFFQIHWILHTRLRWRLVYVKIWRCFVESSIFNLQLCRRNFSLCPHPAKEHTLLSKKKFCKTFTYLYLRETNFETNLRSPKLVTRFGEAINCTTNLGFSKFFEKKTFKLPVHKFWVSLFWNIKHGTNAEKLLTYITPIEYLKDHYCLEFVQTFLSGLILYVIIVLCSGESKSWFKFCAVIS